MGQSSVRRTDVPVELDFVLVQEDEPHLIRKAGHRAGVLLVLPILRTVRHGREVVPVQIGSVRRAERDGPGLLERRIRRPERPHERVVQRIPGQVMHALRPLHSRRIRLADLRLVVSVRPERDLGHKRRLPQRRTVGDEPGHLRRDVRVVLQQIGDHERPVGEVVRSHVVGEEHTQLPPIDASALLRLVVRDRREHGGRCSVHDDTHNRGIRIHV